MSWSLRRDLRECVHPAGDLIAVTGPGTDSITVLISEDRFQILMDRRTARLLALRLNQCLDGTTRAGMRQRRREQRERAATG